ncbi:MAG: Ig-like domain-containing protein [Bacteroidales bacterium]
MYTAIIRLHLLLLASGLIISPKAISSELREVLPITNKILVLHFDDGSVNYPNALTVNRLNISNATDLSVYLLTSSDDTEIGSGIAPVQIGRKSKGTEFVRDVPWGGSSANPTSKPWASEHWIYLVFPKPLQHGKNYTLHTGSLATNFSEYSFTFDEKQLRSETVHVNTLGYASDAPKYGYLYQWRGDLGNLDLTAYAGKSFFVYKDGTDLPVKTGVIKKRKSAGNAETSQTNDTPNKNFLGAEVYECDFSDLTEDGNYQLVVEGMGTSYPFRIGKDAVFDAYYATMRALYHQRSGIRLAPPYTAEDYIRPVNQNTRLISDNGTSFAGKLLYSDYSFMDWAESDGGGSSQAAIRDAALGKPLDVAGWYHDAGDWDSYYTHQRVPILLMLTWEYFPDRFADDDLNIPESGNGIPDILDEASWLVKFNYRLRKELMQKGYSNGGVGGARICADVFTAIDGNAESNLPSWKENRRTVVTKADAFMTYLYSGQAAQLGYALKKCGKNPHRSPVEMLDSIEFDRMSHDTVDWVAEAEEAYTWASDPANQPAKSTNYPASLNIFRMYAAVNLYRLTGKENYHAAALLELNKLKNSSSLGEDERWGVYSYLLADNYGTDKALQSALKSASINTAVSAGLDAADKRACRWGGNFGFPMLVGQGTTPWMFENIIAYGLTRDKKYSDVVHTTADYFLGSNPLHTSWITGVGPRPPACGFHLDSRYNHNWVLYPGFVPYGLWSMAYGYTPYTWTIDGVSIAGGAGTWNKDWANFSMYPPMDKWPGHERWNSNIHAPLPSENTIHQNAVYAGLTYGFVNARHHTNENTPRPLATLTLEQVSIELDSAGQDTILTVMTNIPNGSFAVLKWESSDNRIAHVDGFGRVTAVNPGTSQVRCLTLDGSVSASCTITCSWPETAVDSIDVETDSLRLFSGQSKLMEVFFYPPDASNQYLNWSSNPVGIVNVDENNLLSTLAPGTTTVYGSSLNGGKTDSCLVTVLENTDYCIADFDSIIPVTTYPQGHFAQIYAPGGSMDTAAANPLRNLSNPGEKVVQWNRPSGTWRLIGMVLDTLQAQDLSMYSQFRFKYFGKEINDFYIQLITVNDGIIEINANAEGEDCWKMFVYNLHSPAKLKQFNLFINKTESEPFTCFLDDFVLAAQLAPATEGLALSDEVINLQTGDSAALAVNLEDTPYSWISTDPAIATIDQEGIVRAVAAGSTSVKAVPLLGEAAACVINVEGEEPPVENKTILDFENYELDWSAGYGAYAWASATVSRSDNPVKTALNLSDKVVQWERDGTNFGGGFAVVFPSESTKGYSWIRMHVLPSAPLNSFRIELLNGDELLGGSQQSGLSLPAGTWSRLEFNIADLNAIDKTFSKINFMPAVGTTAVMTVFTDNITLGNGTVVIPDAIGTHSFNGFRAYPNPASSGIWIEYAGGISRIILSDLTGRVIFDQNFPGTCLEHLSVDSYSGGIYILSITGKDGQRHSMPLSISMKDWR